VWGVKRKKRRRKLLGHRHREVSFLVADFFCFDGLIDVNLIIFCC
jgi:hypothetical protein